MEAGSAPPFSADVLVRLTRASELSVAPDGERFAYVQRLVDPKTLEITMSLFLRSTELEGGRSPGRRLTTALGKADHSPVWTCVNCQCLARL